MNLRHVASTLTISCICILPLAVTTGCTGPPRGTVEHSMEETAPGGLAALENTINESTFDEDTLEETATSNTTQPGSEIEESSNTTQPPIDVAELPISDVNSNTTN